MKKNNLSSFSFDTTDKIAGLAKLEVNTKEKKYLTRQFNETLKVIDKLNELETKKYIETSQVTGLKNIFREDNIEKERILTQKEALANAKKTHNGYFVVKAIFDVK